MTPPDHCTACDWRRPQTVTVVGDNAMFDCSWPYLSAGLARAYPVTVLSDVHVEELSTGKLILSDDGGSFLAGRWISIDNAR